MQIQSFEPTQAPSPLTEKARALDASRIKLLGISPFIDDGICGFRVIWRPFLVEPIPYIDRNGHTALKRKSHQVRTMWFPIVGGITEQQAFDQANATAAREYRTSKAANALRVNWEHLARAKGQKIRREYAKPALNGEKDRAAALFELGYSPRQVAEKIGVHRTTASRWRKSLGMA